MLKHLIRLQLTALAVLITASGSPSSARLQDDAAKSERRGDHFHVICDFENDAAAEQALEAVEAAWDYSAQLYKLPRGKLKTLLEVNLYRTIEKYEAVEKSLTNGVFKDNMAFTHRRTNTGHIALQPPLDDERLAQLGLPSLTLSQLAHESVHSAQNLVMPNNGSQPHWIKEGSACWVSEQAMRALGFTGRAEEDPFLSTTISKVQRAMTLDATLTAERILSSQLGEESWRFRYAANQMLFKFMIEGRHEKNLKRIIKKAGQLGGGDGLPEELLSYTRKIFNEKKMAALNEEFREYIEGLEPEWWEKGRSLERRGEAWLHMAFPGSNPGALGMQPIGREEYTVRGELEIFPTGEKQQLNLLLDCSDSGFVSIAFKRTYGINVFHKYQEDGKTKWQELGRKEVPEIQRLDEVAFEVHVDGLELTVSIEGREVLNVDLPRKLTGPWGLGAQSGSAGFWRNLKIEP